MTGTRRNGKTGTYSAHRRAHAGGALRRTGESILKTSGITPRAIRGLRRNISGTEQLHSVIRQSMDPDLYPVDDDFEAWPSPKKGPLLEQVSFDQAFGAGRVQGPTRGTERNDTYPAPYMTRAAHTTCARPPHFASVSSLFTITSPAVGTTLDETFSTYPVRAFLSSLNPPMDHLLPTFVKVGIKNGIRLHALAGRPDRNEFLVRCIPMDLFESMVVKDGLDNLASK